MQGLTTHPGSSPRSKTGKYKEIVVEAGLSLRARILNLARIKILASHEQSSKFSISAEGDQTAPRQAF